MHQQIKDSNSYIVGCEVHGKFQASMKWRRKAATNDEAQLQRVREDFRYWQPREREIEETNDLIEVLDLNLEEIDELTAQGLENELKAVNERLTEVELQVEDTKADKGPGGTETPTWRDSYKSQRADYQAVIRCGRKDYCHWPFEEQDWRVEQFGSSPPWRCQRSWQR